ncbi:hypothetical protein [Halobacillus seohaensis]
MDNIIKVCKGLGISTDDLEKLANGQELNEEHEGNLPEFKHKG